MNDSIKLIIKGFIVGLGKVIPGVSGSVLAIMLQVYEPALKAISNIKKNFFVNLKFLSLLGTGIISAIVFGSKILLFLLDKFYLQTIFLFIGIMLNGLLSVTKEIKIPSFKEKIISFLIVVSFLIIAIIPAGVIKRTSSNIMLYFISGIVDAFASIVPGISGTALLMLMGTYYPVLNSYATIFDFQLFSKNFLILVPFFLGVFVGTYLISKIIGYAFDKYRNISYCCITGFIAISMLMLVLRLNIFNYNLLDLLLSSTFFIIGFLVMKKINILF